MAEDKKAARRILKPQPPIERQVAVIPSIQGMLDEALSIVGAEIVRFRWKVQGNPAENKGLNANEARMLQGYIRSLVDLSKEAREREDDVDFNNMTDEELLSMVEAVRKKKELEGSSD